RGRECGGPADARIIRVAKGAWQSADGGVCVAGQAGPLHGVNRTLGIVRRHGVDDEFRSWVGFASVQPNMLPLAAQARVTLGHDGPNGTTGKGKWSGQLTALSDFESGQGVAVRPRKARHQGNSPD